MMNLSSLRVVDWIEGAVNLRDFGGYPTSEGRQVRSGILFRSGSTHAIASAGLARVADERMRSTASITSGVRIPRCS